MHACVHAGVRVILENPRQRNELLQYVTEEMQGFEGLLQYLGGTRYTTMCDRAELALRNVNQVIYCLNPLLVSFSFFFMRATGSWSPFHYSFC